MNRFHSALVCAAALACAGLTAGAFAQEKSKMPAADSSKAATHNMAANKTKMQHKTQLGKNEVRNWKAIDKNHDNLIEPDEMEAYLKHKG